MKSMEPFAIRVATAGSSPVAILALPVLTMLSVLTTGMSATTLVLSILSLSYSQLILLAGAADTRAIKAAVEALVKVNDKLPDVIECD